MFDNNLLDSFLFKYEGGELTFENHEQDNNKCRTNKAKVVSISNVEGDKNYEEATSMADADFIYRVGEKLEIKNFDLVYNAECASGIHFFRTREEAINYY